LIPVLGAGAGVVVVAIVADFARIGLVRGRRAPWRAARDAAALAWRGVPGILGAWAFARSVSLVAVASAAAAAASIGTVAGAWWRLPGIALVDLTAIAVDVTARAGWLAWCWERCERAARPSLPPPVGRPADTAGRDDPSSSPDA
jgi:hypothetical protein